MKKLFLLLAAIITMSINAHAEGVCATLQHGTDMKAYYGENSFKNAYADAVDGDIITLSKGSFISVSTIAKSIKIYGTYGFRENVTDATVIPTAVDINADNVYIDGVYFKGVVTLGAVTDCIIRHCYLCGDFKASGVHTNTIVDQCVVLYDYAVGNSINYTIKNSTVDSFKAEGNKENMANIINCVIYNWTTIPYAIYKNNIINISYKYATRTSYNPTSLLAYYSYAILSEREYYYNLFKINDKERIGSYDYSAVLSFIFHADTPNEGNMGKDNFFSPDKSYPYIKEWSYFGNDGTSVGPMGGAGFTLYPVIPRITSSEIDPRTDDEGKLNVKINVKVGD